MFNTKAYQDKTCKQLLNNNTRDKILQGNLNEDEYTSSNVFELMKLLQTISTNTKYYQPITREEWSTVVISW